jgi:hypothetical protein
LKNSKFLSKTISRKYPFVLPTYFIYRTGVKTRLDTVIGLTKRANESIVLAEKNGEHDISDEFQWKKIGNIIVVIY